MCKMLLTQRAPISKQILAFNYYYSWGYHYFVLDYTGTVKDVKTKLEGVLIRLRTYRPMVMYIWINGASIKSFWGKLPIILLANSQKAVLKGLYTSWKP